VTTPLVQVFVDGGVRRGRDAFTALALGATAVLVGRPLVWGLAAAGQLGVEKVLALLTDELRTCMQLCGTPTVGDIDASFVVPRSSL
jgi:isopentenyl diphosphate isomerase/L-lactate dehydrogenase-like FMN-dependent dehydrogenase